MDGGHKISNKKGRDDLRKSGMQKKGREKSKMANKERNKGRENESHEGWGMGGRENGSQLETRQKTKINRKEKK